MKTELPTMFEANFWISITLIGVFAVGVYLGVHLDHWYGVSIAALFLALNIYRLQHHIQRARLREALEKNPELKRLFDSRDSSPD